MSQVDTGTASSEEGAVDLPGAKARPKAPDVLSSRVKFVVGLQDYGNKWDYCGNGQGIKKLGRIIAVCHNFLLLLKESDEAIRPGRQGRQS